MRKTTIMVINGNLATCFISPFLVNGNLFIFNVASKIYSSGNCNVIGRKKSFNPSGAAFVNGASAHSLEFDDNCYAGVVHGSAVVFPAVLAFAQHKALSGLDLLKSFVVGLEIEFAVAKAFSNSVYDKGLSLIHI